MAPIASTETKSATEIVSKFEIEAPFDPPSGFLSHHHVQTIGGFLLRQKGIGAYLDTSRPWALARLAWDFVTTAEPVKNSNVEFWDERERISTPDGDWFHADTKYANQQLVGDDDDTTPTVLILHGLESSSDSALVREMANVITNECHMHCTCVNFRGCTGTPNDTPGAYHLGFTDDLRWYLERRRSSGSAPPLYLTGFSLGANAILKCLGELGADATSLYNIQGGVALCAPLDQERNARALARPGINRIVYTNMLLKTMKAKAQDQLARFGNNDPQTRLFDYPRAMAAETITEFDDAFIAPIYGYKDCWEYYRETSSIYFVENITVPTLILNAKDDPFMDPEVAYEDTSGSVPVRMVSMPHGGHLGFALHQTSRQLPQGSSWYTYELGRFLQHVQQQKK